MLSTIDNARIDFEESTLILDDEIIPLESLGVEPEDLKVNLFYKLKATYESPNGKFSLIFSNSALVDC